MVTKSYYNLIGGLNTSSGLGTINQGTTKTESPEMVNVEYYKLSGLQTMAGNTQFGNQLPSKITLGYEYILEDNNYLIICTKDGSVYEYDPIKLEYVEIYKFKTPTNRHSIASFNYGIIISNGVDDLVYYNKKRNKLINGSVTMVEGQTTVTGVDSAFTKDVSAGDQIRVGENTYFIDNIVNDTSLELETPALESVTEADFYLYKLSKCNATLVNTVDDSVSIPVRGLALNTYRGRIWVGDTDGRLFYSEVGNIHGWDMKHGAGAFDSFFEDNTDFVALGIWSEYLVAHKRERTYLLDASNDDSSNWVVKQFSEYTCDSQQSYIVSNNGYYIYSREGGGIYPLLSRSIYSVLYQGIELSIKIHDSFKLLNEAKMDEIFCVYHPTKKYIMFYMPFLDGIGSNECFCFDIQTKSWLHRRVPQNVTCAFQYKDQVYIGTDDGKILKEFWGRTFDGEKIEFSWKSPWFTWGGGTNWTTTREARFKISEEGASKFHVRTLRDGSSEFKSRLIDNNNPNLDSLEWDIGYQAGDEAVKDTQLRTLPVYKYTGSNQYIYYSLGNTQLAHTVPIKMYLDKELTDFANYSSLIKELVPGTEDDNNYVTYETQPVYAWGRMFDPEAKLLAFKHPTIEHAYCWVDIYRDPTKGFVNYYNVTRDHELANTAYTEENTQVTNYYNGNPQTTTAVTPKSLWGPITMADLSGVSKIAFSVKCRMLGAGAGGNYGDLQFCFNSKRSKAYTESSTVYKGNWNVLNRPSTPYNNNHNLLVEYQVRYYAYRQDTIYTANMDRQVMDPGLSTANYPDLIMQYDYEITPSNVYGGGSDYKVVIRSISGYGEDKKPVPEEPFEYTFQGHTTAWDYIGGNEEYTDGDAIGIISTLEGPNFFYGDSVKLTLTKTETVWNGHDDPFTDSRQVDVESFSEQSIVVDGVTFTRDKSMDTGYRTNDYDMVVYTPDKTVVVGSDFYFDSKFTVPYSFVKRKIDDNTVQLEDEAVLSRAPTRDTENEGLIYYKNQTIRYENNGQVSEINNPDYYNYPAPTADTVTDTVWDEQAWVKTGHITKRILLPNQYFQSLQFEFFGDALEENMYLYGFEVDGIQLTEHPW